MAAKQRLTAIIERDGFYALCRSLPKVPELQRWS